MALWVSEVGPLINCGCLARRSEATPLKCYFLQFVKAIPIAPQPNALQKQFCLSVCLRQRDQKALFPFASPHHRFRADVGCATIVRELNSNQNHKKKGLREVSVADERTADKRRDLFARGDGGSVNITPLSCHLSPPNELRARRLA